MHKVMFPPFSLSTEREWPFKTACSIPGSRLDFFFFFFLLILSWVLVTSKFILPIFILFFKISQKTLSRCWAGRSRPSTWKSSKSLQPDGSGRWVPFLRVAVLSSIQSKVSGKAAYGHSNRKRPVIMFSHSSHPDPPAPSKLRARTSPQMRLDVTSSCCGLTVTIRIPASDVFMSACQVWFITADPAVLPASRKAAILNLVV